MTKQINYQRPNSHIMRGDIYYSDLPPGIGSEQRGARPVLILSNNIGNIKSPTVICAVISSSPNKAVMPTHVKIDHEIYPVKEGSFIMLEHIKTLSKQRLHGKICSLDATLMSEVNDKLKISLGMQGMQFDERSKRPKVPRGRRPKVI